MIHTWVKAQVEKKGFGEGDLWRVLTHLLEGVRRAPAISSFSQCRRVRTSNRGTVGSGWNDAVSAVKYFRTEATRSFGRAYRQPGGGPESAVNR